MSLVDRAKNIVISPKTEWDVVAQEEPNMGNIITGYVIPLALIPTIATLLRWSIIGHFGFTFGIAQAVIQLLMAVLGVYITAFVVNALATSFQSQQNLGRATQLIAYAYTPAWIAGILNIIPGIAAILTSLIMLAASIYGLYLLYLGTPVMMGTPKDKVVIYLIVTIIILVVVYVILAFALAAIIFPIFGVSMLNTLSTY